MKKSRRSKTPGFKSKACPKGAPQKKGICLRLYILTPKKPNSAKRKVAKIGLTTGQQLVAYIPGRKHTLQRFSNVILRGGKTQDLPGLKYKVQRGALDCLPDGMRRKSLSKYGMKKIHRRAEIHYGERGGKRATKYKLHKYFDQI